MITSEVEFDSNLNRLDSLLNLEIKTTPEISFDEIGAGVIGATDNTTGVEVGADVLNNLSYLQSRNFITGSIGWQLLGDGNAEFVGITLSGGTLKYGKTSFTDSTNAGYWIGALGLYFGSASDAKYLKFNISTGAFNVTTNALLGTIALANLDVATRGWVQTCAFSITDADTVAWGAGVFTSADGTAYNIGASNTGNMTAKTYIYLDTAVSTTAYQTTTTSTTAVGAGKVLIAISQNGTTEATFKVLDGQGGENIDASSIVANSITANELSTSITYAGAIVIDTAGNIRSGQTAFNTGTGWWIGNDSGTPKFSFGNSAGNRITWDGTSLIIVGTTTDTQTFTADDTWTKPAGGSLAFIQCWGGGGSGGRGQANNAGGGGGGGAYTERWIALSSLGATESVTIGTGGVAQTSATTAGNVGGNTTFGSLLTAYGGGAGDGDITAAGGGGGGGALSVGSLSTAGRDGGKGGRPYNVGSIGAGGIAAIGNDNTEGGGGGGSAGNGGSGFAGGFATDGGGGGGGGSEGGAGNTNVGGNSLNGGGGGGGGGISTNNNGAGGSSINGGAGGAGAFNSNAATAGSIPSGGGGGSETGNSGAGANGKCIVTVF